MSRKEAEESGKEARRGAWTVVGIGEILWDLLPGGKQLGGAPANFACHARSLGSRGTIVSCVGRDAAGREIRRRLRDMGLSSRHIATSESLPTGTVDVSLDRRGRPTYTIHEDVAWDRIPMSAALQRLARTADAICFGSLCQRSRGSRLTIVRFLESSRPEALRVFDANLRQRYYSAVVLRKALGLSNILKLNDAELPVVARLLRIRGRADTVMRSLLDRYALRLICLTRGCKGSVLLSRDACSVHPGFRARVVDTVGAGDAFTAAVTIGLLQGRDLDTINDAANRLAAHVCSRLGATPSLPRRFSRGLYI